MRIPKCKWHPVVAPFVGFPFSSEYWLPLTPYTYFGPTNPITWPFDTSSPSLTIYVGDTWQYVNLVSSTERVIVYPPPPRNPVKVISPSQIAISLVPSGAGISIPVWLIAAPVVGAVLFPKYELILV